MTTVGRVIGRTLHAAGVRHVMGHPGGEVVDLIEGLREEGLEFILTRHETAAAFMADAMGSFSGVPGVCVATLGPGATNLVTGVAQAYLDRSPVIALTGQLPVARYEITTHQKLDLGALFAPVTKWHARVSAENAAAVSARALRVATAHRAGPVHLEIPSDVARQNARDDQVGDVLGVRGRVAPGQLTAEQGARAATLLRASGRPLILAGLDALRGGASGELRRFAERHAIPVMVAPKAKGVFPEDHPLFLGTIEMLGTAKLYEFIDERDLVLMVGFDPVEFDRDWTAGAKIVHIGPLPNDDLYYRSDAEIVGPVGAGIALLDEASEPRKRTEDFHAFREVFRSFVTPSRSGPTAQQVLAELRTALPREAIVTCDVGHNKAVTGQCWTVTKPNTFFMSNGLSSMGYGLPAAMGLKLLNPGTPVACVTGDGGLGMVMAELETAVRRKLGVLVVVLADDALSQIKAGQERKGFPVTGTTFGALDYTSLAKGFGLRGREVSSVAECRDAFKWARDGSGPTLIAAHIDPASYKL